MLKLAQALGAWSPGEGVGPSDPVVLLGAAWSEIVGEENARNSHPAQLAGDTLMIVTASSVWSAQLSYLAEQIVAALQARVPRAGITKVRFRVGKLPARGGSRSDADSTVLAPITWVSDGPNIASADSSGEPVAE